MSALLEVDAVEASYGAAQALFGVSLAVGEGEAVALMGRNGMGKTTTIRTICRLMRHHGGRLRFSGQDIGPMPPFRVARLGVGLVPEGRRCFGPLTVRENLVAAARPGEWTLDKVHGLFPRLQERQAQPAATLSGGEQQMLAIGRALMTNPRLLVLDEATEGLAPVVRQEIWSAISALRRTGLSILVVDKSLKELKGFADRCVILEKGASVWQGTPADLTDAVATRYLGV
ncbi:ABC transporter ATP-binding protein [Zhengella sp. ZM62]|uniref:ABC transporter ATP-binding protein n=1 Tax=Zhengella sedimenti TaxID=3390035 RepID=UPI003974B83B